MNINTLTNDMYTAMKNGDTEKKLVLSSLLSNIKNMAIEQKCKDNIPDELVDKTILKEIKTVKEQIDACPTERTDLLEKYKTGLAILEEYAPKMLSEDEVKDILNTKFADVIATKNKGQIMKTIMPELKSQDGKLINKIVDDLIKEMEV